MDNELDNKENPELNVSPRDEMVNLINSQREETVNSEILQSGGSVEPMHQEEETPPAEDQDDLEDIADPLDDFIFTDEDGSMKFKMQVDGEEVLMPLEDVQRHHQLEAASRKKMEENANMAKSLTEREEQIRQQEAALEARLTVPPSSDVDDQDFRNEAKEIFSTLIEDDAEEASSKLAKVLSDINGRTSSQTPVDINTIVEQTTATIERKRSEQEELDRQAQTEEDFQNGLTQFEEDYPHIYSDPKLFGAANQETIVVSEEHPEWSASEVMIEAGRRTDEWLQTMKGAVLTPDNKTNDRQQKKDNLVILPQTRTGVQEQVKPEQPQTPAEYMAELRAGRGQPG